MHAATVRSCALAVSLAALAISAATPARAQAAKVPGKTLTVERIYSPPNLNGSIERGKMCIRDRHCILRVRDGLPLGHLPDETLAGLRNCHYGRRRASAFLVRDHYRLAALHNCDDRVRCPEVNSNNLAHLELLTRAYLNDLMSTRIDCRSIHVECLVVKFHFYD